MNIWERLNCVSLAAVLLSGTLLAGHSMQATGQPAAVIEVVTEQPAESEPSGVRGLTVGELLEDAWSVYGVFNEPKAPSGQFTILPEYFATYEGSAPELTPGFFAIESINFPGVFHVFHMVASQRA